MISRSWRDASANLLRRGIYKRKTLEERVQFFAFKLRKEAKKKGKKDKLLKEDITKLLTYVFDANTLATLPSAENQLGVVNLSVLIELWLYAEDEMSLWDHFDEIIAKSDKVHIRSGLLRHYLQIRCAGLYDLNLDLVDDALDKHADLAVEVDPTKEGKPENAENLVKVFKHYFDAFLVAFKKIDKDVIGWFQHIQKKEADIRVIKAIVVLHLLTPSILIQSANRDMHKKPTKKPKKDSLVRMRKYVLICKILSSSMFGNKHKEEFLRGADAYTLEVAEQLDNATKELLAMEIDTSYYFHPIEFSVDTILDALSGVKEQLERINKKK
jgi:hypothetical protein